MSRAPAEVSPFPRIPIGTESGKRLDTCHRYQPFTRERGQSLVLPSPSGELSPGTWRGLSTGNKRLPTTSTAGGEDERLDLQRPSQNGAALPDSRAEPRGHGSTACANMLIVGSGLSALQKIEINCKLHVICGHLWDCVAPIAPVNARGQSPSRGDEVAYQTELATFLVVVVSFSEHFLAGK